MTYRTVMRFPQPLRLLLEVDDPTLGRIHRDVRLVGVGRAGVRHAIEVEDSPGRPPGSIPIGGIPIGSIRSARRPDGYDVDLRRLILDPAYHRLMLNNGRPPARPGLTSASFLMERLVMLAMIVVLAVLLGLLLVRLLPDQDAETAWSIALMGAVGIVLTGVFLREFGPQLRILQELRLLLGLWRA